MPESDAMANTPSGRMEYEISALLPVSGSKAWTRRTADAFDAFVFSESSME